MKLSVVNFVRCTGYKCLNFLPAIQKRKKRYFTQVYNLVKKQNLRCNHGVFFENRTCFLYSNFQRSAQNLPMWKITWKSIWNLTKCSDLHSFFFFFSQLADFFAIQLQRPLCDLLCCKKNLLLCLKKKLLLVGKEVVWLVVVVNAPIQVTKWSI